MKEKVHAFWAKHPTAQVVFAYPFLIIVYVVFGTLEAFWSAIKAFFGTFVECYDEFKHHIATIKKGAEKNRKSLKEKLQSRVQKSLGGFNEKSIGTADVALGFCCSCW